MPPSKCDFELPTIIPPDSDDGRAMAWQLDGGELQVILDPMAGVSDLKKALVEAGYDQDLFIAAHGGRGLIQWWSKVPTSNLIDWPMVAIFNLDGDYITV